jgi:nucleoside 2-deoxyribosyltransferase
MSARCQQGWPHPEGRSLDRGFLHGRPALGSLAALARWAVVTVTYGFSPLHEVGPGPASIVGPADIKGLEKSDAVFAILNGLDAGTVFEVGYAVKKGIPVVCFAQNVAEESLKMVEGTGCEVVDDFVSALYRTIWRLPKA